MLVSHDLLALHILRSVDHGFELFSKDFLEQLSVCFGCTLIFRVIAKLCDSVLQLSPSMDEWLELALELETIETHCDTRVVLEYTSK